MQMVSGLLYSQIGYDLGKPVRVLVRHWQREFLTDQATAHLMDQASGAEIRSVPVVFWGEMWQSCWWVIDLSDLVQAGRYRVEITDRGACVMSGGVFEVEANLLWERTWRTVALEQNERRMRLAMNGVGWQDCGAAWQEANSHAALIDGLCDLLEYAAGSISQNDRERIERQICTGCDYLALLQDRATELGFADGAVSHQKPKFETSVLPGDVSKAVVVWSRSARLLGEAHADKRGAYQQRALRALNWLRQCKPLTNHFANANHGAPAGYCVPDELPLHELLMIVRGAVELAQAGVTECRLVAEEYARRVLELQVTKAEAESELYGHFFTFSDRRFTDKAWVHHVDRGQIGMDAGGHYPHYILPLLQMLRLWPDSADAARWRQAIKDFAYGYLLPACRNNPFHLLPLGYFHGEGLLWFSGLWHGMNGAYLLAAALALELEHFFGDAAFGAIATGNLQWIAGLNAGLTAEGVKTAHMFSADILPGVAQPVSMIHGIGEHYAGSYMNIRGSICNGFSTGEQFAFDVTPSAASDGPFTFTDEDWITHAGAWLAALARQQAYAAAADTDCGTTS